MSPQSSADPGRPGEAVSVDSPVLERRFRETLENVSMIAVVLDLTGRVTFANDFLLALTGWERQDVLGEDWFDRFLREPHRAEARRAFEEGAAAGEMPRHHESEIVTRDGEPRIVTFSTTILRDDEGRPEGVISLGDDVTARRGAEELLRSREELFRSLIENASDVIAVLSTDGTVLYTSPSIERVLDWKPEELIGTPGFALLHGDDVGGVQEIFDAVLAGDEPGPTEFRLRHRDGSWRTVEAIGRSRQLSDDEQAVVVNYRDITDQRVLREQLAHAQRLEALGRLAGGVAHDFNNLLTAIGGYGELLVASFDGEDVRREDALEIVRAVDRATALTGQLLAFSRRQVLGAEVLDVAEVIASLERLLSRLLGEGIAMEATVEPGCAVRADRGQLEQVVTNLVVNARDAMPGGGRLELSVRPAGDQVELMVGDSGGGIDAATLPHIFEPFYTTKEAGKGTGLGLATVYGIVTQSGGEISVTSEPGAGTRFRILLPRVDGEVVAHLGAVSAGGARRRGSESVLIAEDEETIRRLVGDVLTQDGYTVYAAASGDEALALLEEHGNSIDLLLTDVVMPGMRGPELARAAARLNPSLRVLFASGYTSEPDEAFDDPELAFIGKPFSPQALVAKVREVLDA